MYMMPTVTSRSKESPVRPSMSQDWPVSCTPARLSKSRISSSLAPSNTGVAMGTP